MCESRVGGRFPGRACRSAFAWVAVAALLSACGCARSHVSNRPNIVVVVIDTLRADAVGWYDATRSVTPFLDDLAADGGAIFWNAYANAPATSPSVASLLTS
ncbi:MAG: sulfatase-like hydrolase/transferase, partial [Planctomycetota bacterium]